MRKLMLGNEAVARGLYEAGCRLVSSYPGTPSTEITEEAAKYDEIYAEWAPNEKVALEVALGASIAGGRSFCGMKHVGLNVAADPLFIGAYIGVAGGMIIGVADDPGMHSSQNEQDSRHYAIAAKLPMVEPTDSDECKEFVKAAYEMSEAFDTPVILRLNTRISHSQSVVELCDRTEKPLVPYEKNPAKRVMMPGNAKKQHVVVEERLRRLAEYANDCPFNRVEDREGAKLGIITSGPSYQYAKEVFGDTAAFLKIGMPNPLPDRLILDFASRYERIIVIEELDDILETHCRKLGLQVDGKNLLPNIDEFSQELLADRLLGKKADCYRIEADIPARPPVLCPGCPHRGVFYLLKKLGLYVSGDIGCYTLGNAAPLDKICALAEKYDALVMVDECHSAGVLGKTGRGITELYNLRGQVDILTGTLGKAFGGAVGGFTTGRKEIIDMLRQRSRPYLFSNSLPPAVVGAGIELFRMLAESNELHDRLVANVEHFRAGMMAAGFDIKPTQSAICAVMLYDAKLSQDFAAKLQEEGVFVTGFYYPVVPKGQARIRVQVSAGHTFEQLDRCIAAFKKVGKELNVIK